MNIKKNIIILLLLANYQIFAQNTKDSNSLENIRNLQQKINQNSGDFTSMSSLLKIYSATNQKNDYITALNGFISHNFTVTIDILKKAELYSLELKNYKYLLKYTRMASNIEPRNVEHMYYMGLAFSSLKEYDMAKASLEFAYSLEPKNTNVLLSLARLYVKMGLKDTAIIYYKRLLFLYSGLSVAQQELDKLLGVVLPKTLPVDIQNQVRVQQKPQEQPTSKESTESNNTPKVQSTPVSTEGKVVKPEEHQIKDVNDDSNDKGQKLPQNIAELKNNEITPNIPEKNKQEDKTFNQDKINNIEDKSKTEDNTVVPPIEKIEEQTQTDV